MSTKCFVDVIRMTRHKEFLGCLVNDSEDHLVRLGEAVPLI
jgi:hypothetical protein